MGGTWAKPFYIIYFPCQSLDSVIKKIIIVRIQLYHTAYMDVFLRAMAYMWQLPTTHMPTGCSSQNSVLSKTRHLSKRSLTLNNDDPR